MDLDDELSLGVSTIDITYDRFTLFYDGNSA